MEFSEGKNLRFRSELRIFHYLIKSILSHFCRSAKHNTSQQRNTVSRISSANELLPAQSKLLVDVLIQAARLCLAKKTFYTAFSVLEKYLCNVK